MVVLATPNLLEKLRLYNGPNDPDYARSRRITATGLWLLAAGFIVSALGIWCDTLFLI